MKAERISETNRQLRIFNTLKRRENIEIHTFRCIGIDNDSSGDSQDSACSSGKRHAQGLDLQYQNYRTQRGRKYSGPMGKQEGGLQGRDSFAETGHHLYAGGDL